MGRWLRVSSMKLDTVNNGIKEDLFSNSSVIMAKTFHNCVYQNRLSMAAYSVDLILMSWNDVYAIRFTYYT